MSRLARLGPSGNVRAPFDSLTGETAVDLKSLVLDSSTSIDSIAEALDKASPSERRDAALSLNRSEQRALYEKAAASRPLTLADFVPDDKQSLSQVRHFGRNTLPMMRRLQLFEKRFCRPEDRTDRLFGYNQSPFIGTIGPGFFVAVRTNGHEGWPERGAIVTPETAQEASTLWRTGRVAHIPNAGHSIRRDQYEPFRTAVTDFLREVSG